MASCSRVISQAEDAAGLAGLGGVDRHVDGQAALAHGGSGAQDDQVGPLQPAQVIVQVRETGHDGQSRRIPGRPQPTPVPEGTGRRSP